MHYHIFASVGGALEAYGSFLVCECVCVYVCVCVCVCVCVFLRESCSHFVLIFSILSTISKN